MTPQGTRVLVLGASGMLGTEVATALVATKGVSAITVPSTYNICNLAHMQSILDKAAPTHVINCAGRPNKSDPANAMGPHVVARVFHDARLVHVSTDCVFGTVVDHPVHPWRVGEEPEPDSDYGWSKFIGEIEDNEHPNALTVRTSFIGFKHGLLAWLMSQPPEAEVPGWTQAWWSGSTVFEVAHALVCLTLDSRDTGLAHLATPAAVSKYTVLTNLVYLLRLDVAVRPVEHPIVNRALEATHPLQGLWCSSVQQELIAAYSRWRSSAPVVVHA